MKVERRARETLAMDELHLCFAEDVGMADCCCCCGGSASLGGMHEPIPGSVPSLRYCSVECHDDWEDFLAERRERGQADD